MQRIVVLKSFIEIRPGRLRSRVGKLPGLLLMGSLLTSGLAWSAPPPTPPPLVQQARPDNQLMLELLNRIERLEEEVRQLRGDLDLYRHHQEQLVRRVQTLEKSGTGATNTETPPVAEPVLEPTSRESQSLELEAPPPVAATPSAAPSLPPGAATPPVARAQPPAVTPATGGQSSVLTPTQPTGAEEAPHEQDDYKAAFDSLHEGRYDEAVNRFQDFLTNYPTSRLAGDAQYWLGETYYVVRDFDKARQVFLALGMNYPNSKRVPDAMLKLGYIYADSGDKAKAREVLQKLTESYPDSRAATLARQRLQAIR